MDTRTDELHCYYDGGDYVIARSPEDASAIWREQVGEDHDPEDLWNEVAMACPLRIDLDDKQGPRMQTAAAWIAECGRGFLCSENF